MVACSVPCALTHTAVASHRSVGPLQADWRDEAPWAGSLSGAVCQHHLACRGDGGEASGGWAHSRTEKGGIGSVRIAGRSNRICDCACAAASCRRRLRTPSPHRTSARTAPLPPFFPAPAVALLLCSQLRVSDCSRGVQPGDSLASEAEARNKPRVASRTMPTVSRTAVWLCACVAQGGGGCSYLSSAGVVGVGHASRGSCCRG